MREFFRNVCALCCAVVIFSLIAIATGLTPEGVLDGKWPSVNDHPTNWYDTSLHPNQ